MINELLINAPAHVKMIPLFIYEEISDIPLSSFEQRWFSTTITDQTTLIIPDETGALSKVYVKINKKEFMFTLGDLYEILPQGIYYIANTNLEDSKIYDLLLGFALGSYRYNQYQSKARRNVQFSIPQHINRIKLLNEIKAHYLTRTLINRPSNDLTPDEFSATLFDLFKDRNCEIKEWKGTSLIENNFPLIYHVGKASEYEPRLIEVVYGNENNPHLSLVGKGVCFDSGGLDIKPSNGMRLMKKDMGGAAHALNLAEWIISNQWPIHLRLLLPIVENSISSNAMRPGDIIIARNGKSVEIDNTDAEGRLILADTLTYATEQKCDTLLCFATLTGAARVALGTELPALFSTNDMLAMNLMNNGMTHVDPVWRLPFYEPYHDWILSKNADMINASTQPYGGAITAALFLKEFLVADVPFAHIDLMAWNIRHRAGRPIGGEAMGLRAAYYGLAQHFNIEQ